MDNTRNVRVQREVTRIKSNSPASPQLAHGPIFQVAGLVNRKTRIDAVREDDAWGWADEVVMSQFGYPDAPGTR